MTIDMFYQRQLIHEYQRPNIEHIDPGGIHDETLCCPARTLSNNLLCIPWTILENEAYPFLEIP